MAFVCSLFLLVGCRASLRPDFAKLVDLLGPATRVDPGKCDRPKDLADAFAAEITGKPEPLSATILPFSHRAAAICPNSHPFVSTGGDVDLKKAATMLGVSAFEGDGRLQMEPWLWLRAVNGKVIGVELDPKGL
jgi:hypothetical protein